MVLANSRGNIAIWLVCALLVGTTLCFGFLDVGLFFIARARAQTAADAAALAAAMELASPLGGSPVTAARDFAFFNSAELESCDCDDSQRSPEVVVSVDGVFIIARFAGISQVKGRARASIDPISPK